MFLVPRRFLTLVGSMQAKIGFRFVHYGSAEPCNSCQLKKVCIENLEPGRIYEVVNVRELTHPCTLHENGVRAVEVILSVVPAALEPKQAVKGATIVYRDVECAYNCTNIDVCKPSALKPGDRCIVEEVNGNIVCPMGKSMKVVLLRPAE
ncbi:MAG: UPF0179 family protein [Candidatus Jordarchaeales archaeon]